MSACRRALHTLPDWLTHPFSALYARSSLPPLALSSRAAPTSPKSRARVSPLRLSLSHHANTMATSTPRTKRVTVPVTVATPIRIARPSRWSTKRLVVWGAVLALVTALCRVLDGIKVSFTCLLSIIR